MPPTINATLSRTSAVTAPPNMRVDSTKPPIGVSISTCPAVAAGIIDNTFPHRK